MSAEQDHAAVRRLGVQRKESTRFGGSGPNRWGYNRRSRGIPVGQSPTYSGVRRLPSVSRSGRNRWGMRRNRWGY